MDANIIFKLTRIIDDYCNRQIKHDEAKNAVNSVLHNKSNSTVFNELSDYNKNLGKEKNISTIIVVISLFIRNLDDQEQIKELVVKHNMTGPLYGGLYKLFCDDLSSIKINVTLCHESFQNKYEFIRRYFDYGSYNWIAHFQCVKTLYMIDETKFEKLAYNDKTKLILLNMTSYHLNIKPSDALLKQLITNGDELNQNIALYFVTFNLESILEEHIHSNNQGSCNKKVLRKKLTRELAYIDSFINCCDYEAQVHLLFNYLLQHPKAYPCNFARILLDVDHQSILCEQIRSYRKIRSLKELEFVTSFIEKNPALDKNNKRISKSNIYCAITDVLINFVEEGKGIYGWDSEQERLVEIICKRMPRKCVKRLYLYLKKKQSCLMCSPLDEMVRFKIFLEDERKNKIIEGIFNIMESNN